MIVFEILMFANDLNVTTKVLIGVGIEHGLILLKFGISMIVSDLPIDVALELRRQRNVRQQKIGDHFSTVEAGEDGIDSPAVTMAPSPLAHNSHMNTALDGGPACGDDGELEGRFIDHLS